MQTEKVKELAKHVYREKSELSEKRSDKEDKRGLNSLNSLNSPKESFGEEFEPPAYPVLSNKALYGIAGDIVELATKNSEADPAAVLATFIARFGVEVGSNPYMRVGDTKHRARIAVVLVGDSSKARKGTSYKPIEKIFKALPNPARVTPGPFSSGEGIIYAVRDAVKKWDDKNQVYVDIDPGIEDKRLFVCDEEFSGFMANTKREGNTLSMVARQAWDSGDFEPLTKNSRITATNAHISWVSHITKYELMKRLAESEAFNGFANRILWVCAQRKQLIAWPQPMEESRLLSVQQELTDTLAEYSCGAFEVKPSQDVIEEWRVCYPELTRDKRGLVGCVVNRAEAQVLRLAMIYALMDCRRTIEKHHLDAARAFWKYCEESAFYIFHGKQADNTGQRILDELKKTPLSSSDIFKLFSNHKTKEELEVVLSELQAANQIEQEKEITPGRPKITWRAINRELSE